MPEPPTPAAFPIGCRVQVRAGGAYGTVLRVSPHLKAAILVRLASGAERAFRPDELTRATGLHAAPAGPNGGHTV